MAQTFTLRIAPVPKGDFSTETSYSPLDIVHYNGASYICVAAHNGEWADGNWQLLCEDGSQGAEGTAASITIGETTTGEPGTNAQVTNSGSETAVVLNFTIPKGEQGAQGIQGPKGDTGEGFSIYKTYPSVNDMNEDAGNVEEGKFVLIASDVEDEDNAKLYVKGSDAFTFLTDLSGAQGIKGETGDAATISIGTVTTGEPGSLASVTNSGTTSQAVLDISIPRGATGATGADGTAATIEIGTVTTGEAGTNASVENVGTANAAILNIVIPKGEKGDPGDTGPQGVGITDISSVDENGEITITLG